MGLHPGLVAVFLICGAVWLLIADLLLTADLLRSEARLNRDLLQGRYVYGQERVPMRSETIQRRVLRWSTGAMLLLAVVLALTLS